MHKVISVIFGLSLLATASANTNLVKSHFDELADLYKGGTRPPLSTIDDIAWSGRCFDRKDNVTNAGYIVRKKTDNDDAGPIGQTSTSWEGSSYTNPNKPANYFDNLDISDIYSMNAAGEFNTVRIVNNSNEIAYDEVKSNLRKSGKYLVEEISNLSEAGPIGSSKIEMRCYYFVPAISYKQL